MNIVCKKGTELQDEDLGLLYDISSSNNESKSHMISKEKWIELTKKDNNLLCALYSDGEEFVGFILISMLEKENFISDFEIVKKYQSDGKTFKEMIKMLLPFTNTQNIYTGVILTDNIHAKNAFKSIGACPNKKKYVVTYEKLISFLDKNVVLDAEMHSSKDEE